MQKTSSASSAACARSAIGEAVPSPNDVFTNPRDRECKGMGVQMLSYSSALFDIPKYSQRVLKDFQ